MIISKLMRVSMVALAVTVLSACGTVVPVVAKFPEPPGRGAMATCPDLKKLETGAKLSDIANTVTMNYSTYYECVVKTEAWIEWYSIQKTIFEKAGR
jgi:hypothetical protein